MKNYKRYPENRIPLRNKQNKVIGWIIGDRLVKYAVASKHMLRSPRGWAIDKDSLEYAAAAGVREVVILDQDADVAYIAPLSSYFENGLFVDRGYGEQLCLTLEFWRIDRSIRTISYKDQWRD